MDVVGLWRYPVKSLQGEPVATASIEDDGVVGDRRWGIRDERTGRILTARRRPELLDAAASYVDGTVAITLSDGTVATGPGERTDRLLSAWLDSPVTLVEAVRAGPGQAEYFEDATDDSSRAIEWTMPDGRYVDAAPLLVLTTASLRTGAALHPDGTWDPRRFRPNILLDLEGDGWLEDAWVDRPLRIGGVTLLPVALCTRCTMVTRPQPGLDDDRDIFRTLARHHRGKFGVWSEVVATGTISVGDAASVDRSGATLAPS